MSVRLSPEDHDAIARRVVELLRDDQARPDRWLTADQVALRLGVGRDYVYRHADELRARRLGEGPRARLRFDPEAVEAYGCRTIQAAPEPAHTRTHRKVDPSVHLLPIRKPGRWPTHNEL
jgi:hypothetical protein